MQWESCLACSHLHFGHLVPENVKQLFFSKFELTCMHARPLRFFDAPYLFRVCVPWTCAHIMHARHDITRFTDNANHVMTSLAFASICFM